MATASGVDDGYEVISPVEGHNIPPTMTAAPFVDPPASVVEGAAGAGQNLGVEKSALLIIDLQEDFCPPYGSLAVSGGREIAPAINELLQQPFSIKVATRDFHPPEHISFAPNHGDGKLAFQDSHTITNPKNPQETDTTLLWPPHCIQDTTGCDLIPELDKHMVNYVVNKGMDPRVESYSAFGPPFRSPPVGHTWLWALLDSAKVKRVFVVGLALDYCVKYTALDAAHLGFETYVLTDCTKAVDSSVEAHTVLSDNFQAAGIHLITRDQLTVLQDGHHIAVDVRKHVS